MKNREEFRLEAAEDLQMGLGIGERPGREYLAMVPRNSPVTPQSEASATMCGAYTV